MINARGVVIDAGLCEASPVVREGLLALRPRTAHLGALLDTDEAGSDTNVVVLGVRRFEGYGPTHRVRRLRDAAPALGIFVDAKHGMHIPLDLASVSAQIVATQHRQRVAPESAIGKHSGTVPHLRYGS